MTFVAPNLACGEARGGRIPCHGAVTDEQRSHRPNSAQPGGRQVFFAQTSLLAPHRSTAGYARRSRLVWAKNPLPRTSSYLCLRPLSRMPSQGDDVPFTILFPDEKTPPNASIPDFLPDSQHHSWNETITNQAGGFGILNLHNLEQLLGWNFPNFHINSFASQ